MAFYVTCGKKGLSVKAAAKEINNVEGPGTIHECVAQNRFWLLKEGNTRDKNKPTSVKTSVIEDEPLLEITEQPNTSTQIISVGTNWSFY